MSVREVGVVDPEIKVDVKSDGLGPGARPARCARATLVSKGQVLAEVEPDVNQAQSLSDVKSAVDQAELQAARRRARATPRSSALFDAGLIGSETLRDFETARDLAADTLLAAAHRATRSSRTTAFRSPATPRRRSPG